MTQPLENPRAFVSWHRHLWVAQYSVVRICQTIRASCFIDGLRQESLIEGLHEAQPVAEARKEDGASMTVLRRAFLGEWDFLRGELMPK